MISSNLLRQRTRAGRMAAVATTVVCALVALGCSREPDDRTWEREPGETQPPASASPDQSPAAVGAGAQDGAGAALANQVPELGTEPRTADRLRFETWPDIRDASYEERHTFREGADEILILFDREIRNLRTQTSGRPEESTSAQGAALRELQEMRLELQARISDLNQGSEEEWERARAAFAQTWERARQAYREAFATIVGEAGKEAPKS